MKILNAEEGKNIVLRGNGNSSVISAKVAALQVNELLIIPKADWRGKNPPYRIINRVAKNTGRKFQKGELLDTSGWGVRRLS